MSDSLSNSYAVQFRTFLLERIPSVWQSNLPVDRFGRALVLSAIFHLLVITVTGGGQYQGKAFARRIEAPPLHVMKVDFAKAQGSGKKSVAPVLPPPLQFPRPESDTPPPPPAPHIGEHSPGEGEHKEVATPLTDFPYYSIKELTKGPQVVTFVNVEFENMAGYQGKGRVKLILWINEEGIVDLVTVENSDMPQRVDDYLRTAFMGAKFAPGEKDGNKVRSKMPIEVNYKPVDLVNPVVPLPRQRPERKGH